MSGRNDRRSTTIATVLNLRMGSETERIIAAKTRTAQITSTAVSRMGGITRSGMKVGAGRNMATATTRTSSTATIETTTVNGPSQIRGRIDKYAGECCCCRDIPIPPSARFHAIRAGARAALNVWFDVEALQ